MPGIICAALATLVFGAVLGPEAPLILIGAGVAVLLVHLVKKDAPAQAVLVIGAAGSFAAISTLLINPLAGAFLLLEAAGIGGGMVSVVLAPGLLAAGIALSHLPGLPLIDGVGMGIGAFTVVMLGGMPLTAVLLALLFLQADAVDLISIVIVAVVIAWVASARLSRWLPQPAPAPAPTGPPAAPAGPADRAVPAAEGTSPGQ